MYFNYHAKIRKLIAEGHLTHCELTDDWHGIRPALVLYFDNARPMPVRRHRWEEYAAVFDKCTMHNAQCTIADENKK